MSAAVVIWQLFWGLWTWSGFVIATNQDYDFGDWSNFWTGLFMFSVAPIAWLVLYLYALTPAGKAEAERLRENNEKAYALRHPAPKSVFEESARRSTGEPAPGPRQVSNSLAKKPGMLLHPTPENFEEYCRDWCHYLGYYDAVKTQNSRDGGIDIKSPNMIAQVKFQVSPVGVRPIRELNGVRKPSQEVLFFALNGFTPEARREASEMNITLIRVSPLEGQIDILA